MDKRVQIVLLGLMIWALKFTADFIAFAAPRIGFTINIFQDLGFQVFAATIGLAPALFLVFRDNGQDYKRTGLEAGIAWYVIMMLLNFMILVLPNFVSIIEWYPDFLFYFTLVIIPIVFGYLLAGPKSKV